MPSEPRRPAGPGWANLADFRAWADHIAETAACCPDEAIPHEVVHVDWRPVGPLPPEVIAWANGLPAPPRYVALCPECHRQAAVPKPDGPTVTATCRLCGEFMVAAGDVIVMGEVKP